MSEGNLRSAAHRRILIALTHGPATVTDLAQRLTMQMPHASLACRQLRAADLVVRDESGGLRNAPMYLSQQGLVRLNQDALAKLKRHAEQLRRTPRNILLHADESNVLFGYIKPPPAALVFVPEATVSKGAHSSGSQGGTWVLTQPETIEWYALDTLTPTTPPEESVEGTLAEFDATTIKIGLVRGEVFERSANASLVEGQFFDDDDAMAAEPPVRLTQGPVPLGTVMSTDLTYAPAAGLVLQLPNAIDRSLALAALGQEAVVISDQNASRKRRLPYAILRPWLTLRHARMSVEKRGTLLMSLRSDLQQGTVTPSLLRDLLVDFGTVDWMDDEPLPAMIDSYGMSVRGMTAVVLHVLENDMNTFVVDWPFEEVDLLLQQRVLDHPRCRAWLGRYVMANSSPLVQRTTVFPTSRLGVVSVQVDRSTSLVVQLGSAKTAATRVSEFSAHPSTAFELLHAKAGNVRFSAPPLPGEAGQRMSRALSLFPTGDEALANQWERKDALSSWIASPPSFRPSRWVRLHDRLPDGWGELMSVDEAPLLSIPAIMGRSSPMWRRQAIQRIVHAAALDPTLVMAFAAALDQGEGHHLQAAALLCILDRTDERQRPLFQRAQATWFGNPVCEVEVLEHVFPNHLAGQDDEALLDQWVTAGLAHGKNTTFRWWALACQIDRDAEPWLPETQRRLMEHLPEDWWQPFAAGWLVTQLNSSVGREWLGQHDVCWPVQLGRNSEELGGLPGRNRPHGGLQLSSNDLIGVKLLTEGNGQRALDDVYEMVFARENGISPPVTLTHPLAGWLARPVATWPRFGEEVISMGDERIGRLLYSRSFAYRQGISSTMD